MLSLVLLQIGKSGLLLLVLYLDISINCDIQNCHNKYLSMVGYRVGGLVRLLEYTGSLLNCQFCHANVSWSNRESQFELRGMDEEEHFDCLVIGAGISGLDAAYHLQKHAR